MCSVAEIPSRRLVVDVRRWQCIRPELLLVFNCWACGMGGRGQTVIIICCCCRLCVPPPLCLSSLPFRFTSLVTLPPSVPYCYLSLLSHFSLLCALEHEKICGRSDITAIWTECTRRRGRGSRGTYPNLPAEWYCHYTPWLISSHHVAHYRAISSSSYLLSSVSAVMSHVMSHQVIPIITDFTEKPMIAADWKSLGSMWLGKLILLETKRRCFCF